MSAYTEQRARIEHYFDRTAPQVWERLTSDAPVSRIRATVRAGRNEMHTALLSWMPADLTGRTVLDAGCGTGTLAIEAARRGASVVGVDISPRLTDIARKRALRIADKLTGSVIFLSGDMLEHDHRFDHVIAMDSIIHYQPEQMVQMVEKLSALATRSVSFTVAPRTALLATMHRAGQIFPKRDRSPAIVPVKIDRLCDAIQASTQLADWELGRDYRVNSGFYISHALEVTRA